MTRNPDDDSDRIAYSISELGAKAGGISRTTIYREIRDGKLISKRIGQRRVVPRDAALEWIKGKQG